MQRRVSAVAFLLCLLFPFTSLADSPELRLPWPCGKSYYCSQGQNTSGHSGNSAWAWDFAIPIGDLVTAPAAGQISRVRQDSTEYGCDRSYAHDANYVVLDLGNGTEALFVHLEAGSAMVSVGDWVEQGDPIARVGLSGYVCGAHLHFQIQEKCNNWYCQSVPASFEYWGMPEGGDYLTSYNCPDGSTPVDESEHYKIATAICTVEEGSSLIMESQDTCVTLESFDWHRQTSQGGWELTYTTTGSLPREAAKWHFMLETSGVYQISAFIPEGAESSQTSYYVQYASGSRWGPIQRNQSTASGWMSLGNFSLQGGAPLFVELPDNTGELGLVLAASAVAITPFGQPLPDWPVDDEVEEVPEPVEEPEPDFAADLSPVYQSAQAEAGAVAVFKYHLCNTGGESSESYGLHSNALWPSAVSPAYISSMTRGTCVLVEVEHFVPGDLEADQIDIGTLTVESLSSSSLYESTFETTGMVADPELELEPEPEPDPAPLTIDSVAPDTVSSGSTTEIVINGSGFQSGATLRFSNGAGPSPTISSVVVADDSTIHAVVQIRSGGPPRERHWDVQVALPNGTTATLVGGLTIQP
jgi:hypothetical protein